MTNYMRVVNLNAIVVLISIIMKNLYFCDQGFINLGY